MFVPGPHWPFRKRSVSLTHLTERVMACEGNVSLFLRKNRDMWKIKKRQSLDKITFDADKIKKLQLFYDFFSLSGLQLMIIFAYD